MPALERDEDVFMVESETVPLSLSKPSSPGASGDFGRDSKQFSYGSTADGPTTATVSPTPPTLTTELPAKDPEQWPLLGAVLPPPGGWSRSPCIPPGLTTADILPLANDPFWCRIRATLFALFWVVMVALLASVAVIVVNDPHPCSTRTPPPLPPQHQTFNVSLPLSALPVLQAVAASRY